MVIVGTGECGVRAAMALRELAYTGPVTLIGTERHAPYERPPLSKELMSGAPGALPKTIATTQQLADLDIAYRPGCTVTLLEPHHKLVTTGEGSTISYDRLLLATGATPRRLELAGADGSRFVTLRTYDDAVALRSCLVPRHRVVIVGGGFIGLEVAAAARGHDVEVTVLETRPGLLSRIVPAELATRLEARHRAAGVEVILGVTLTMVEDGLDMARLHLSDGRRIAADLVVMGIGAVPETTLAAAAGLAIDNGIAVDENLRTSDPAIYAAGDCCSAPLGIYGGRRVRLESWRAAQDRGVAAARNMLGLVDMAVAVPWFWSDQYEFGLQIAGLPDEGDEVERRETNGALVMFHLKHDGRLVAASGLGIGNSVARDIRVAQMLIERQARPDRAVLADPARNLKSLLAESPLPAARALWA